MKVFIHGFWVNFLENTDPNKFIFFKLLLGKVFNENIIPGSFVESEILLESVFSPDTYIKAKKWRYTIFFNGESLDRTVNIFLKGHKRLLQLPNYDCILSGRFTDFEKKIINLPLFVSYLYSNQYLRLLQETRIITNANVPKKNICAIISNGDSIRNRILDAFDKRFKIDYAGSYRNNVYRIPGSYNSKEMFDFISGYKFIIAFENTKQETYITEKIVNGFIPNIIPIYWGSNKITDYFNADRFINIVNTNTDYLNILMDKIASILQDDGKYLNIVNQPVFTGGVLSANVDNIAKEIKQILL